MRASSMAAIARRSVFASSVRLRLSVFASPARPGCSAFVSWAPAVLCWFHSKPLGSAAVRVRSGDAGHCAVATVISYWNSISECWFPLDEVCAEAAWAVSLQTDDNNAS
jgi:hypothetical protein